MEVEAKDAELFIMKAKRERKLVKDLKVMRDNGKIIVPLAERVEFAGALECERDFMQKEELTIWEVINRNMNHKDLKINWQRIGNTLIFNKNYENMEKIADELVTKSMASQVYVKEGKIEGMARTPKLKLVSGIEGDSFYRENGVIFVTNPANLMMSKGNIIERGLPSIKEIKAEAVLDMFSGIGYFSLPVANLQWVRKVVCIDLNREALQYLAKSSAINKVENKVITVNMDCRFFKSDEMYDLVLMGNFKSKNYLASGLSHVKNNGYILLHHLELTSNITVSTMNLMKTGRYLGYTLLPAEIHVVKSYAPHVWHLSSLFKVAHK